MEHELHIIPHVMFHPRPSQILKTQTYVRNGEGLGIEAKFEHSALYEWGKHIVLKNIYNEPVQTIPMI